MINSVDDTMATDISVDVDFELNKLEDSLASKSTKDQESLYVNKFKTFLTENGLCADFERVPSNILNNYLRFFYSKLEKKNNELYTPSTLVCIRASIQRHLDQTTHGGIDIRKDKIFQKSNNVLKKKASMFLENKCGKIEGFPAIEEKDMIKINHYFDQSTPSILQQQVWFNITYHLGLRGREAQRHLTTDSLVIKEDSDGKRFVALAHDFITKNTKASQALNRNDFETIRQARMYELGMGDKLCPVKAFEIYLQKIGSLNGNVLFPKCCTKNQISRTQQWYSNAVIGKNTLGTMMKTISKEAGLSKIYTNHSIRVTTVNVLKEAGYTNDKIQGITGHRSDSSVTRYCRKRKDSVMREMSNDLTCGLSEEKRIKLSDDKNDDSTKERIIINLNGTFQGCSFSFPNSSKNMVDMGHLLNGP